MSKPPINPDATLSGITVDPRTLERVIPESKRSDGTLRKEIKIRPGFTPQEDVRRFRGTKQADMDARQLPKGHIIGWVPPSNQASSSTSSKPAGAALSKSQKKNQKKKEKREAEVSKKIKDSWEDEDDDDAGAVKEKNKSDSTSKEDSGQSGDAGSHTADAPTVESEPSRLAEKLKELELNEE